ncbi:L7Ae/L30e/S12e/Gadd45 family ribosomal protein [Acetonema longum]|uniref:Ribosomal protein L7Ae/L30e/S12e/Gadd45 n=1 Tax=Acetonema longum DSM 6540 TaxID=1009370 RepID=F7NL91_9FIRM|nr:ribosomal L7Ae/L30e/S12e/Gadd45 family protein [Acetonema longum]EGO63196.1 ribosomal protein L7Ae/L30e/S12e/Gadd45 [Acetonema longum DSM 6540]
MHTSGTQCKLIAMLGLAQKAGKVISGDDAITKAARNGSVHIVLIAADASDNTRKGYQDMANYYKVVCVEVLSKEQLGASIGKAQRAALAITDAGFGLAVKKLCLEHT